MAKRLALCVLMIVLATAFAPVAAGAHPQRAARSGKSAAVHVPPDNSHYCNGCAPPLYYSGGATANTTSTVGLTIRPIYWLPAGVRKYVRGYEKLINRYITDIASDSGSGENVYSVTTQYYQRSGATKTYVRYKYTAGAPIIDTHPFPKSGCTIHRGYTNCLTDDQLRTELLRLKGALGLRTTLSYFYPLFTAPTLQTRDRDGSYSDSGFCGYHRSFVAGSSEFAYGNEVYERWGCGEGQSPNGNIPADSAISTLSHEISENVTDPLENHRAWMDDEGYEIGDICGDDYGTPLGSTDPADRNDTEYNQLINGHPYYTQTEFSNAAYKNFGIGYGCQQSQVGSVKAAASPTSAARIYSQAAPTKVAADGRTPADVYVHVLNHNGTANVGDPVDFSEYVSSGTGSCGTLSKVSASTDSGGQVHTVYTASKSNAVCAIVAKDGRAGKSTTVLVYQGTYQALAPTATDNFPATVTANGHATAFGTVFTNKTATPLVHAAVELDLFPGTSGRTLPAGKVHLAYSLTGPTGHFSALPLSGYSRVGDQTIELPVGPAAGVTIAGHRSLRIDYRLTIDPSAYRASNPRDTFHLESFLDQVNIATGTTATLADTFSTHVAVAAPAASGPTTAPIANTGTPVRAQAATGVLAVLTGIALLVLAGTRRRRRDSAGGAP